MCSQKFSIEIEYANLYNSPFPNPCLHFRPVDYLNTLVRGNEIVILY